MNGDRDGWDDEQILQRCAAHGDAAAGRPASAAEPLRLQAFGDPAELAAYKQLIAALRSAAPDVEVEFIPVGKQRDHMAKLTTDFSGGNPPDLFLINFRRFGQFAAKGVLEPLGPALTARGKFREGDFYQQALEAFRQPGAASQCNCGSSRRRCTCSIPTPSPPCCTTRRATGLSGGS